VNKTDFVWGVFTAQSVRNFALKVTMKAADHKQGFEQCLN